MPPWRWSACRTCLSGVSAICIASLVVSYLVELPAGAPHIFGPVSDLTTSLRNILLVPFLVASLPALRGRSGGALGVSFAFPRMSLPQAVVMGLGLVPGVLAWTSWPVWFFLVGRAAQRAAGSRLLEGVAAAAWGPP